MRICGVVVEAGDAVFSGVHAETYVQKAAVKVTVGPSGKKNSKTVRLALAKAAESAAGDALSTHASLQDSAAAATAAAGGGMLACDHVNMQSCHDAIMSPISAAISRRLSCRG